MTEQLAQFLRDGLRAPLYEEDQQREAVFSQQLAQISPPAVSLPSTLPSRVIAPSQLSALTDACRNELSRFGGLDRTVHEFVAFCELLSRPENHVLTPVNQFTEIQVPTRTVRDMQAEMAQELMRLPKYTAYVKVLQQDGQVLTAHVQMSPPPPQRVEGAALYQYALTRTRQLYCTSRREIEREWRSHRILGPDRERAADVIARSQLPQTPPAQHSSPEPRAPAASGPEPPTPSTPPATAHPSAARSLEEKGLGWLAKNALFIKLQSPDPPSSSSPPQRRDPPPTSS